MEKCIYVSIMLPAFVVNSENQIEQILKKALSLSVKSFEIIEIPSNIGKEMCVRLIDSCKDFLNLNDIETLINENRNLRNSYEKCKESLQTLSSELDKLANDPNALQEQDRVKFQKQTKKLKALKDENKRLRQLLKSQLENSDKQRIETQATVESLREELDLFVRELNNLQKKQTD
ncbi:hypothetical protein pb186bvf_010443 [Paramecium bursaria]